MKKALAMKSAAQVNASIMAKAWLKVNMEVKNQKK